MVTSSRGRRRPAVVGRREVPSSQLQGAAPPCRDIFVSRVREGTVDIVQSFLQENSVNVKNIEKMSHENSKFCSFKMKVLKNDLIKVFDENFWPNGVRVDK